jgi:peptidoglycan/LPS O-acetylase OafA/YrhL
MRLAPLPPCFALRASPDLSSEAVAMEGRAMEGQGRAVRLARPSLSVLTSLRFFAAAAVVIFHIVVGRSGDAVTVNGFLANLANGGYAAVTFFFILSGFILTYAHAGDSERVGPNIKARTFWKLRFARILPAWALGLVLALPIVSEFVRVMPPFERVVGPVLVASLLQAWYPPQSARTHARTPPA